MRPAILQRYSSRHGETNKKIDGANLSISQSAGEGALHYPSAAIRTSKATAAACFYGPSPDGDGFTNKLGEIKLICTVDEAAARGFSRAFTGGLGFFPAHPDGSIAGTASLILKVGASGKITNQDGQLVATCSDWTTSPSTTGPKKITIAAGVDAVLVAALISEWDANRFKNKD